MATTDTLSSNPPASKSFSSGSDQPPVPPKIAALLAGLTVLTGAVIGLMTSFNAVHWTSAQTTLAAAEVAAFWALAGAVTAHLWPQTKKATCRGSGHGHGLRISHVVLGYRIRLVAAHTVAKCVPDQPGHRHRRGGLGTGRAEHCSGRYDARSLTPRRARSTAATRQLT